MTSTSTRKEGPPPISSMLSSAHDLDVPLTRKDLGLVEEFEAKWSVYMKKHPELMPGGGSSKKVDELRAKVLQEKVAEKAVEVELQEQLKLFGKTRDMLEHNYNKAMQESVVRQRKVEKILASEITKVKEADAIETTLVDWQHFLNTVDKSLPPTTTELKNRTVKPSRRAMALVDHDGDEGDVQLRAYRIDHALLSVQVEMLEKEINRVEKITEGLDLTGEFLTENNIWSLLSKGV